MTPLRTIAAALLVAAPAAWGLQDAGQPPPDLDGTWNIVGTDGKPLKDKNGDDVEIEIEFTPTWFCQWDYEIFIIKDGERVPTNESGTVEELVTGLHRYTNSRGGTGTFIWNEKEGCYDTHSNTTGDNRHMVRK